MAISKKVKDEMLQRFQDQYGIMKPALHYNSPFELMIAVILSAQCTDERVNIVTAGMFPEYNTPEKMLTLGLEGLEEKIRTCGLYHSKAKNILANCAILCEKYHGEVPQTFDELVKLPGVGRKTANVLVSILSIRRPLPSIPTCSAYPTACSWRKARRRWKSKRDCRRLFPRNGGAGPIIGSFGMAAGSAKPVSPCVTTAF